jgi:hypothetical protein
MVVASEIDLGRYVYARLLVDDTAPTDINYDYVSLVHPGYDVYWGATTNEDQWLFFNGSGVIRWFEPPCTYSGYAPPSGARLRSGVPTDGATCFYPIEESPYSGEASVSVDYPYLSEDDIGASTTLTTGSPSDHPFHAQVWPWDSTAPPVSSFAGAIGLLLESSEAEALRAQLDWERGEDGQDPSTEPIKVGTTPATPPATDPRRFCEHTPPGTTDTFVPEVNEFTLMSTYPTSKGFTAQLRAGSELLGSGSYIWKNVKGFGLRKIIAKHGWLPSDRADTAAALVTPWQTKDYAAEEPGTDLAAWGRFEFDGPPYALPSGSGAPTGTPGACHRIVVVDTLARNGEPTNRGIITSYAGYDANLVVP